MNWLHDALCYAVESIHVSLDQAKPVPDWPDLLPSASRERLVSRLGLYRRLKTYWEALDGLSWGERALVRRTMVEQNNLPSLLASESDCATIDELPERVQGPVGDLFAFAFGLLSDIEVRDEHYAILYNNAPHPLCPFCGCEYFDSPGGPREALDHFLAKSRYPFAAANLYNLVPMGNKCNSRYKLSKDILRDANGNRRRAYDPYGSVPLLSISLDDSVPFGGVDEQVPDWVLSFEESCEEADTWVEVFSIRERYTRDVLDAEFKTWLGEFSNWCRSVGGLSFSGDQVLKAVEAYSEFLATLGLSDRAFLKRAVFQMVHRHCCEGDERLVALVNDLVRRE